MLKVDPQRQAVDSQRGYNYQTWQSLYRWIRLENWFSLAKQGVGKSLFDLVEIMKDLQSELRSIASLFIMAWYRGNTEDLFYVNYLLVADISQNQWPKKIEGDIGILTKSIWLKGISEQALSILSPMLNIPIIKLEFDGSFFGLKKAARILLAANNAIQLYAPKDAIDQLKSLVEV